MPNQLDQIRTPPHDRAIGIEVECFLPYDSPVKKGGYIRFFKACYDVSLVRDWSKDVQGWEFVSQPLTRDWLVKEVYKLYSAHQWSTNLTCGIHLHVSKKWCGSQRAKAIAKFLSKLSDEDMSILFGRAPNRWCQNIVGDDRYQAVNLQNAHTVEFRSFASGDAKWAHYCIMLVDYMVRHAHRLTVHGMFAIYDMHHKM